MKQFGEWLRFYRLQCNDPARAGRPLTQERLGELIGMELGDAGYTGAAVSEWERGKSQIHKDQRTVLTALIKVLTTGGGLKTIAEANTLLLAGNYRQLDETELALIFPEGESEMVESIATSQTEGQWRLIVMFLGELIYRPSEELRALLTDVAGEPPPRWPRVLLRLIGWPLEHWSSGDVLRAVAWIAVWLLTWWLTFPLMQWPVVESGQVDTAVALYLTGAMILPLFIGLLTSTKNDPFWQEQSLPTTRNLRLYTHQGALIGFHIGYVMIFAVALLGYYLGIRGLPFPLTGLAAAWPVVIGYAAARQAPLNLWRAYGQLRLQDGAIFFVFILFGLLWGTFWRGYYRYWLSPPLGLSLSLVAVAILAGFMNWQKHRTGESILPTYVWVGLFGVVLVIQQVTSGAGFLATVMLIGLLLTIVVLLIRQQIHLTLTGAVGLLLAAGLLLPIYSFDRWLGVGVTAVIGIIWWRWGQTYIWFPLRFWLVVVTAGVIAYLVQQAVLPEGWGTAVFGVITLGLLWNRRRSSDK